MSLKLGFQAGFWDLTFEIHLNELPPSLCSLKVVRHFQLNCSQPMERQPAVNRIAALQQKSKVGTEKD